MTKAGDRILEGLNDVLDYVSEISPWDCLHPEKALTRAKNSLGADIYRWQCLHCGRAVSNQIKHVEAWAMIDGGEPLREWDPSIEAEIHQRHQERAAAKREAWEAQQATRAGEWWDRYNAHLASEEWAWRRRFVLERAGHVCEGCRRRPASDVHHLTYEHLGHELLFELVALCRQCHDVAHNKAS